MMFSSSNHINSFQTCSSSSTSPHLPFPLPPLPFLGQEAQEILLQQNYPDPVIFSAPVFSLNPQLLGQHVTNFPASNGNVMAKQETISCQTGSSFYGVSPFLTKKVMKKDRHSKIYTAQGLRDRRVRLSIEISRKFFDLQDQLGFDKASKTLEWLLTKSRKAIKELARTKQKSLTSGSEVSETEETEGNCNGRTLERPWSSINKLNFGQKKCHLSAKESRAKARERARARTMEKSKKSLEFLHQMKPLEEVVTEAEELSPHCGSKNQTLAEEFTATKRKSKSKGESFDNNNSFYHPNLSQNWDITPTIARSSFCAVTNMNLSADSSFWKTMGSIQQSTPTLISLDLPIQDQEILDEAESAKVMRSAFLKAMF